VRTTPALVKYSCCKEPFGLITYELHLRRVPLTYMTSIIIPMFVIILISFLSYFMTPASGARAGPVTAACLPGDALRCARGARSDRRQMRQMGHAAMRHTLKTPEEMATKWPRAARAARFSCVRGTAGGRPASCQLPSVDNQDHAPGPPVAPFPASVSVCARARHSCVKDVR
jgi:hypothetical protein